MQAQAEVGLVQHQAAYHVVGVLDPQRAGRFAEAPSQRCNTVWEQLVSQRCGAHHVQPRVLVFAQAIGQALQSLGLTLYTGNFTLHAQGFRRRLEPAAHPGEQQETQLPLGILQGLFKHQGINIEHLRGAFEIAGLAKRLDDFDVAQSHARSEPARRSSAYMPAPIDTWTVTGF